MSDDIVWASQAMMDSTLIKRFTSDLFEMNRECFRDAMAARDGGMPIPEDGFPKQLFSKTERRFKSLPDFFNGGGYCIVSTELADALRQFDLGEGSLRPVEVLQYDRETRVPGRYECLSFGARKETFLPERTLRCTRHYEGQDIWGVSANLQDDEIALRETALQGPDLWMETPRLPRVFFLSDPLVRAIKAAKLSRRLGLRRCRVLADH